MSDSTSLSCSGNMAFPSFTGGIAGYVRMVNAIPALSEKEERESAQAYRDRGDADAGKKLVMSHLRLAVSTARKYRNYGLPEEDLIQEGNIGLFKALRRYDPDRGARFATFALYWIKAEIQEFVIRNWRIVKVATTKAQRKLFFNLRRKLQEFGAGRITKVETQKIADDLDVRQEDVEVMRGRMSAPDIPFEEVDGGDEDDRPYSPAHYLADKSEGVESQVVGEHDRRDRSQLLHDAISTLDERSRDVIMSRWLDEESGKSTLHEMAEKYGVSAERIRQIEARAMQQIKQCMTGARA